MFSDNNRLYLEAPAKINLYLEVVGKRDDGYHDIRSVVTPVSVFDSIVLEKADDDLALDLDCKQLTDASDISRVKDEDNLAVRAADLLRKETGYKGGAKIGLDKHIPVGGGLGGGSGNAAAVLIGLNDLWETGLSKEELIKMGSGLGCDVPCMISGGMSYMEGVGEKVSAIPMDGKPDPIWMVLVNPCFGVCTGDIYSRYSSSLTSASIPVTTMISAVKNGNVDLVADALFNSLQETVFDKYPFIEIVAEEIKKAGAIGVLLSGSGSSVFGLATDQKQAMEIDGQVKEALGSSIWSRVVATLPDGVMVAHGPLTA